MTTTRKYKSLVPGYAELVELKEWKRRLWVGEISGPIDGAGFWVRNGNQSNENVFESTPQDATHVAWYAVPKPKTI